MASDTFPVEPVVLQTPRKQVWGEAGPGRPKGRVNSQTLAQRAFAEAVLGKPGTPEFNAFVDSTRKQLLAGILPPAITALILHYAYGKPKETIEVEGSLDVVHEVRRVIISLSEQQPQQPTEQQHLLEQPSHATH